MNDTKTLSPMNAIREMCRQCIYDPTNGGTWLEQTEGCTVTKCALYHLRPVTTATHRARAAEALAALPTDERARKTEINRRKARLLEKARQSKGNQQ